MNPIYHFDIEQRTDEWREIRSGRITGTDAAVLTVKGESSSGLGKGAETALFLKGAMLITDFQKREFEKYETIVGNEREPDAIAMYEEMIFPESVTPCGFVSLGDYFGFSPDGLVGDNGLIEVKCPQAPEYLHYIITRLIIPKYICQMQWGMWVSGRKWCDHVVYNPEFGGYPIDVTRIERDEKMMQIFDKQAKAFESEMNKLLFAYHNLSK